VSTLVYTHGHVDHVGGSGAFAAHAERHGHRRPTVVAHCAVHERFARYRRTDGWNRAINVRQFGAVLPDRFGTPAPFLPSDTLAPEVTFDSHLSLDIGGVELVLHHGIGETDDHAWVWVPHLRAVCPGDFMIWSFPNAGNPQKVQRYAWEWAQALRAMSALAPELLVPAHGLPIGGTDRVCLVLDTTAEALESLVEQTLALMNEGANLERVMAEVRVPNHLAPLPWLAPSYDEPAFVVRGIWRRYGGWWDGDPAHLHPAPRAAVAAEIAAMAGGAVALAERALAVADRTGDLGVAVELVEHAAAAAPDDLRVHDIRAELYTRRRAEATSLMAKGIYRTAAEESRARAGQGT
jgi:alkyl sulfatase BDS1-like metallo-beta-lactamase superfamily hydrolase